MISDILSDAVFAIEDYQRRLPEVYGNPSISAHIDLVKAHMDALRVRLDTPPKTED